MTKFFAKLALVAGTTATLALGTAAVASATTHQPQPSHSYQNQNYQPQPQPRDCFAPYNYNRGFFDPGGPVRFPFPNLNLCQCSPVVTYSLETTWTRDRDGRLVRHEHNVRHVTDRCFPGYPGNPGYPGYPGSNVCTPITFSNSSTGGLTVTEGNNGPILTNGEEVAYGSPATDYYVFNADNTSTPRTFELSTSKSGSPVHLEGTGTWDLTTVCPATVGNGNNQGGGYNHPPHTNT